ncbi:hypothetical protein MP228_005538 [Amoeboaphelidium protococcarum]|nr:hypothetical protein MP228_005538 [Amoeboaphelidium protococcarum]
MSKSTGTSAADLQQIAKTSSTAKQSRIGPYSLGKTLGIGSTGKVKLGVHVETGQRVAIKIISKSSMKKEKDPDGSVLNKKLDREIAIMKLVQHPNVMSLFDVFESQDELYLVLELVDGGELFDYLVKQGRLKEMEALKFFQQIIAGLDYCHKHLICHRDLKPENLLLDSNKTIKIADFGMASLQVTGKMLETSCGSPHYASPEIIRGVKYDGAKADIWSTGIILYALLTGNLPFDDENIRRLLQKVKTGVYVIPDYVPQDAADLVRRMLVVNPEKRISMQEVIRHPWFNKLRYQPNFEGPLRNPPNEDSLKPFSDEQIRDLDFDILGSLSVLGYGSDQDIVRALRSNEPCYEKVFYWLLMQRRNEYLESYEPEKEWWYANSSIDSKVQSPRRRVTSQASRASLFIERGSSINGSMNQSGDPISPQGSGESLSGGDTGVRRTIAAVQNVKSDESSRKRTTSESVKHKSYNPSPLGISASMDTDQNYTPEQAAKAKEAALKALEGQRSNPQVNAESTLFSSPNVSLTSPLSHRSSVVEQFRKKMSIINPPHSVIQGHPDGSIVNQSMPTLPNVQSTSRKSTNALPNHQNSRVSHEDVVYDTLQLGTPKFHRKRLDLQINSVQEGRSEAPSPNASTVGELPLESGRASVASVISNTPKKSWFSGIFAFKPEQFSVQSFESIEQTRQIIEQCLGSVGAQFQASSSGVALKCKYDANKTMSAVKFKLVMSPTVSESFRKPDGTSAEIIEIIFTQQQGALSTFQEFAHRFRAQWPMMNMK